MRAAAQPLQREVLREGVWVQLRRQVAREAAVAVGGHAQAAAAAATVGGSVAWQGRWRCLLRVEHGVSVRHEEALGVRGQALLLLLRRRRLRCLRLLRLRLMLRRLRRKQLRN